MSSRVPVGQTITFSSKTQIQTRSKSIIWNPVCTLTEPWLHTKWNHTLYTHTQSQNSVCFFSFTKMICLLCAQLFPSRFLYSSWPCFMCLLALFFALLSFFFAVRRSKMANLTIECQAKKQQKLRMTISNRNGKQCFSFSIHSWMTQRCRSEFSINSMKTKWYFFVRWSGRGAVSQEKSLWIEFAWRQCSHSQTKGNRAAIKAFYLNRNFAAEDASNIIRSPQFTFYCPLPKFNTVDEILFIFHFRYGPIQFSLPVK